MKTPAKLALGGTGAQGVTCAIAKRLIEFPFIFMNEIEAYDARAQRRVSVKKSSASLIVSAWTASRSVLSGSPHPARMETRPTLVQAPKKTK